MKYINILVPFTFLLANTTGCEKKDATVIPTCINEEIRKIESETVSNPPRSVWQYTYKGKTVYYVPSICCDIPSRLIDGDCKLICNPDGGFTGSGDGKCSDFLTVRSNEKLIWADKRKN
jgi:hypothetical protein